MNFSKNIFECDLYDFEDYNTGLSNRGLIYWIDDLLRDKNIVSVVIHEKHRNNFLRSSAYNKFNPYNISIQFSTAIDSDFVVTIYKDYSVNEIPLGGHTGGRRQPQQHYYMTGTRPNSAGWDKPEICKIAAELDDEELFKSISCYSYTEDEGQWKVSFTFSVIKNALHVSFTDEEFDQLDDEDYREFITRCINLMSAQNE